MDWFLYDRDIRLTNDPLYQGFMNKVYEWVISVVLDYFMSLKEVIPSW